MGNPLLEMFADKRVYRGHALTGCILVIPIPAMTIWLWTRLSTGSGCETYLNTPLLVISLLFLFFSLFGACASKPTSGFCGTRETIVCFLLLALFGLGIFVLTVSSPGGGRPAPGRSYQDYVLDDYSRWLQKRVNNTNHWDNELKMCLLKKKVCHKFFDEYAKDSPVVFFARHFSSIESGCCKPPTDCNYNYTSPTKWMKPKNENNTNMDCNVWDEDPNVLCYNCQSCKAGFANDVKSGWVKMGVVIIVVISLLVYVSPCSSCKGGIYTTFMDMVYAAYKNPDGDDLYDSDDWY